MPGRDKLYCQGESKKGKKRMGIWMIDFSYIWLEEMRLSERVKQNDEDNVHLVILKFPFHFKIEYIIFFIF